MRKNVHIVCQAKGGVGKTFISVLLAQFLSARDANVICADTDPTNHSFFAFRGLNTDYLDLLNDKRNVEAGDFDGLFDYVMNAPSDVVIDTGSSSFVPFFTYMAKDCSDEIFTNSGCNLILHVPIIGGEARKYCLECLEKIIHDIPNAKICVWVNNYPTKVFIEGVSANGTVEPKKFEETDCFKENKSRFCSVINMPMFAEDTHGKILKLMMSHNLTFKEFKELGAKGLVMDGISVNGMQQTRLAQVKAQLDLIMQPLLALEKLHTVNPMVIVHDPSVDLEIGYIDPEFTVGSTASEQKTNDLEEFVPEDEE